MLLKLPDKGAELPFNEYAIGQQNRGLADPGSVCISKGREKGGKAAEKRS